MEAEAVIKIESDAKNIIAEYMWAQLGTAEVNR